MKKLTMMALVLGLSYVSSAAAENKDACDKCVQSYFDAFGKCTMDPADPQKYSTCLDDAMKNLDSCLGDKTGCDHAAVK